MTSFIRFGKVYVLSCFNSTIGPLLLNYDVWKQLSGLIKHDDIGRRNHGLFVRVNEYEQDNYDRQN